MKKKLKMIASENGLNAIRVAFPILREGGSALEACVAAATFVEDDPEDFTVGYGGLPNADGVVELDASVMDGRLGRAGSVAAIQNIRNPSKVARLVLEQTERVLLVGQGAQEFALMNGFQQQNLLTESSRRLWALWKRNRDNAGNYTQRVSDPEDLSLMKKFPTFFDSLPTGTVHIAALDGEGNLACVTTTSGHAFKIPGRVGDSAIVGAGLYAENGSATCGSVGCGEANLQNLTSFAIVRALRNSANPEQSATDEAAYTILRHRQRLSDSGHNAGNLDVRYFILSADGKHFGLSSQPNHFIAIADENGAKLEKCKEIS
jgi:N4-(beta-N-acetylglucosaminyl)-L-asparaginase